MTMNEYQKLAMRTCSNRLNTPFRDLWYYRLKSRSGIDLAISRALRDKKNFNEGKFVRW